MKEKLWDYIGKQARCITQFFLTIQGKLLLVAIPTIFLFIAVLSFGVISRDNSALRQNTKEQALGIAKSVAFLFTNARIYHELQLVESDGMDEYLEYYMDDMMRLDPCIMNYAVLDENGTVLAHSSLREYGKNYADIETRMMLSAKKESILEYNTKNTEPFLRIYVPLSIESKFWGLCRIDFSLQTMYAHITNLQQQVLILALIFFLGSLYTVWQVGRHFVVPIHRLTNTMNTITIQGEVTPNIPNFPKREDEIGVLQNSFVWMLERLHEAEEQRRRDAEGMLQADKLATVGQLASGLAHEINNPLGGTILCFQNLCEGYKDGSMDADMQAQHIDVINKSLEKIRLTVSDFLRFARPSPLSISNVSLCDLFNSCQNLADFSLHRYGISLVLHCPTDLPSIHVDYDKIGQVLLNLVLNSAYAIQQNLQKSGLSQESSEKSILLHAEAYDNFMHITIADTGIGIDPDKREKIFLPFFTTKPEGQGTGLGLAVSHGIITQHSGTIELLNNSITHNNIIYCGAVFSICLPISCKIKDN